VSMNDTPQILSEDKKHELSIPLTTCLEDVFLHPDIPVFLAEILRRVPWQIRNEYSLRRSLSSLGLLPRWSAGLMAWSGKIHFKNDQPPMTLQDYLRHTAPRPEKPYRMVLPILVPGRVWAADQIARSPGDPPLISAAAVLDLKGHLVRNARLALTGVWEQAAGLANSIQQVVGQELTPQLVEEYGTALQEELSPQPDFLGDTTYRRRMAVILTRRILSTCSQRGA